MYSGAGILVGLLNFSESCQRYSNLCSVSAVSFQLKDTYSSVAFISGHDCGEQNSVMEPYRRLI